MDSQKFLEQYLNNSAPVTQEETGQKLWLEYLRPYIDTYEVDNYGSVAAIINPEADYKVVIEAHADEISWYVNYINEDGYIYVIRNGGSDPIIAPSMRVNIHTEKGIVPGVFGWPAIHVRMGSPKDDPKPELKNIFIDCGCNSREEVEALGIHPGTIVTFTDGLMELNERYYVGRALDNRIGGYIIAEATRRLHEEGFKPDFGLYIVNSVQEEVGLRGAEMMARRIKPNVAIVVDVCHDTTAPMYDKIRDGNLKSGKGPVISYAPSVQRNLRDLLIKAAEEKEIPFQRQASSRWTGTDTDAFAYSNSGVVSALISIPLRYMHTTVESVHKEDVENSIKLFMAGLKSIKNGQDFRYFS